jgi:hypothetical protein
MPQGPLVFREANLRSARLPPARFALRRTGAPSFQTVPLMFIGMQFGHSSAIGSHAMLYWQESRGSPSTVRPMVSDGPWHSAWRASPRFSRARAGQRGQAGLPYERYNGFSRIPEGVLTHSAKLIHSSVDQSSANVEYACGAENRTPVGLPMVSPAVIAPLRTILDSLREVMLCHCAMEHHSCRTPPSGCTLLRESLKRPVSSSA